MAEPLAIFAIASTIDNFSTIDAARST